MDAFPMDESRVFLESAPADFFRSGQPIFVSRAPGRLDVMGGISDYSGGLCLEWPLACAAWCAVQATDDGRVTIYSANAAHEGWQARYETESSRLAFADYTAAAAGLPQDAALRWTRYILGAFMVLARECGFVLPPRGGARIFVASDVPLGAGLSSSAAVEVAAVAAVAAAFDIAIAPEELARLCQVVENRVVGAPCGIMDQLTVVLGQAGHLLRLLCQPAIVEGQVPLPEGLALYGIDSNVKHSVGGSAYGAARCAAFMGRRILQEKIPRQMVGPDGQDHLANLAPDLWRALRAHVPETMTGAAFLQQHRSHGDPVTTIDPETTYRVRLGAEHPVYEADRVRRFATLLEKAAAYPAARVPLLDAAGDLMVQSHFSYDHRCGLGAPETDLIVALAREHGPAKGILGAKITGGGAGGTVAVLADMTRNPEAAGVIEEIAATYSQRSGHTPRVWSGSSDGAHRHGVQSYTL